MMDDPQGERRRARWLRNKRAARARVNPKPLIITTEFVNLTARILAERDRRRSEDAARWMWGCLRSANLKYVGKRQSDWLSFVVDVWAAAKILEVRLGPTAKITPTKIAALLSANDCAHGYSPASLRPMVYRALPFIAALEDAALRDPQASFWLPFDSASLVEHFTPLAGAAIARRGGFCLDRRVDRVGGPVATRP